MPWRPLSRIAFAICSYPFHPSSAADLPLQLGDELYIIEEGGRDWAWFRGYLVAPPSLLSGLTSRKGQALEARVFSGIFPRACVEIRELLGDVIQHGLDGTTHVVASIPQKSSKELDQWQLQNGVQGHGVVSQHSGEKTRALKPPAPVPMLKIGDETVTSEDEPLVDEIASCLREWHSTYLHELLLSQRYGLLEELSDLVNRLDTARRQLLHKILTRQELDILRQSAIWDLVNGNKVLSGEVIVRSTAGRGRILTHEDSAIEMSHLQSTMSLLNEQPGAQTKSNTSCHLLVDLKNLASDPEFHGTVVMSLYMKTLDGNASLVSESFSIDVFGPDLQNMATVKPSTKTLFTDLNRFDIKEGSTSAPNLYIVLRIITNEPARGYTSDTSQHLPLSRDVSIPAENINGLLKSPVARSNRRSVMWSSKSRREPDNSAYFLNQRPSTDTSVQMTTTSPHRLGTSNGDISVSKDRKIFKRTTGIGVVDITSIFGGAQEAEHQFVIWSPVENVKYSIDREDDWNSIVEELLPTPSALYRKSRTLNSTAVSIKAYTHADSKTLLKEFPTFLQNVQVTPRIGFAGVPSQPRSDIYVTLSRPFLPEDAWLSHPRSNNIALPNELDMEDIQLTLEVRNASGTRIEHCIHPSSNSSGHTAWRTTAVSRGEYWNQVIKLCINPEDVPGSHIVMSLADAGNFPFALCWMPLWTQGAFIRDGDHGLILYKYDEVTSSIVAGKGAYLALPWSAKSEDKSVFGPVAAIHLRTYLCSTKYSQDPDLLGLLGWREHRSGEVWSLLRRFQLVLAVEIVKLLGEILDALFDIIVEYAGNDEVEDLVLDCLVHVLETAHDPRFDLNHLIDEYTATRFKFAFAFPSLTRSLVRLLSDRTSAENVHRLHASCKVGKHLFKFVVIARRQQIIKEAGIGIKNQPTFAKDLQNIFGAFNELMRDQSLALLGTKTLVIQNFHTWLPVLLDVMRPREVLDTAIRFIDSCSEVQGRLVLYKLVLINLISAMDIFYFPEGEALWFSHTVRWLHPYWGHSEEASHLWRDQIRLCCSVVATLISHSDDNASIWVPKLLQSYSSILQSRITHNEGQAESFSMLFPKSVPFPTKPSLLTTNYNEALIEISALLVAILNKTSNFPTMPSNQLAVLLSDTLHVFRSILENEAFPSSWLSLYIFHHKAIIRSLEAMSDILMTTFLPPPDDAEDFPTNLWMDFFTTLLKVVGSDALALETFPEQKRRAVWKIAGDVREVGADLLWRAWEAMGWEASPHDATIHKIKRIGGYQVQYVPRLVAPIVELCLSVHEGLRGVATAIMRTMIVSEWVLTQDLAIIQAEVIQSLDQLFQRRAPNDATLQKLFIDELLVLVQPNSHLHNDKLFVAVKALTDVIDHLLDLLVAVHNTEVNGDASHIIDTLRLMEFLRDMQKEDIYVLYVHKLAEIQVAAGHSTEAGLALKMHADLYDWATATIVPAVHDLSLLRQTSFDRKEQIYFEMLKHFEDGLAWDEALSAYKELAYQYEHNIFDLGKLARTQRAMATIYENIAKGERYNARFFWVSFRGLGFASNLRDKQFIFQGLPGDRSATFTDRMQQQYPSALFVGRGPIENIEGQYLSIVPVSSQKNLSHPVNRQLKISHYIREHFIYSQPRQFTTIPRRQANKPVPKDSGLEKIVFTTAEAFPTILRRSEVIKTENVQLSPRYTALERTLRKTHELQILESSASNGGEKPFKALTDALLILIHRESGGSVAEYWSLAAEHTSPTRTKQYGNWDAHDHTELCEPLRVALIEHALTIRRCLELYARPAHQATKAELTHVYERTFEDILQYLEQPQQPSFNSNLRFSQTPTPEMTLRTSPKINGTSVVWNHDGAHTQSGARDYTTSKHDLGHTDGEKRDGNKDTKTSKAGRLSSRIDNFEAEVIPTLTDRSVHNNGILYSPADETSKIHVAKDFLSHMSQNETSST